MSSTDLQEKNLATETEIETDSIPESPMTLESMEEVEPVVFEQLGQNPYDLSYTCLLIPRFRSHFLTGDLSQQLPGWLQQICISFGWRLERVTIKPDYLQWVLSVPPATSTAYFMKSIRQQTSIHIFDDFPRFKKENVSKDFWAPGYLIYFGSQPHPEEVVRNFIRHTRQKQGVLPHG